jgi:hypothetical protein
MYYKEFSITGLEKQLQEIDSLEAKIEFISDEILSCEKVTQDLQAKAELFDLHGIKFAIKQNGCPHSLLELLNKDCEIRNAITKKILKTCKEKLCERNIHYLERAKSIRDNLQTKFDLQVKRLSVQQKNENMKESDDLYSRIVWYPGKEKLLAMFGGLHKYEILPEYSNEEILLHFCDEKLNPYSQGLRYSRKFLWRNSDSGFAVFVNELAKRKAIDEEDKFKRFPEHFSNRKGKPFRDLAQKKYYTENYCKTGDKIRDILNSINLSLL